MIDELEIELIEAAVGGDIDSFGKLCQRYYSAMAAIGYSLLADHQLAEDAAQETFARALVGLKTLKNKRKFGPWLAGICRNVTRDISAKKVRPFDRAPLDKLGIYATLQQGRQINSEDILQTADSDIVSEDNEVVRRAIDRLPKSEKELIVLRYYSDLSYEEICCVLGISKAAVNGRLIRAKRKLAKLLKSSGLLEV